MSNPNKAKGNHWELPVLRYLQEVFGRAALRPRQEGHVDVGDVHLSPFALQLKDEARHDLSGYVRDAEKQAAAAGEPFGAAVVKKRRAATEDGYVVMSLRTFRALLVRLRTAEGHPPEPDPETPEQDDAPSQTS